MSVDLQGFDAATVEDAGGNFELLREGDYEAVITASEEKHNKAGTGRYLKLEFQIISGPAEKRKLWANINIDHPNEQTVKIARAELKRICYAVGVLKPNSSSDLHDIPMIIKVGYEKRKDTGEVQNRIKGYRSKSGQTSEAQPTKAPNPAPAPGTGAAPPWKR